jgi:SAM-dependent methyltransferase
MSEIEFLSPATSVSMADEWFGFSTSDHFWMQWRHSVLLHELKRIGHSPFRNALEVGCGHGIVREMIERDLNIAVDGCDLNQTALAMASHGKGRLLVYDIFDRNRAMLKAYDLVLLMDVIEHLEDDLEFLKAALDHLKPGGVVVINVPAHMAFYGKYDEVAGHKRRYNTDGIRSLFQRANLEPLRIVQWGFLLTPFLLARKILLNFVARENTIRTGFVPQNALARSFFRALQVIETSMPFSMPVGTSLLALGRLKQC